MFRVSLTMAAAILCLSLAACGGGGGGDGSTAALNDAGGSTTAGQNAAPGTNTGGTTTNNSGGSTTPPAQNNNTPGSGSGSGGTSTAPFAATVTIAPDSGTTQVGTFRLEIRGSAIENAELLPAEGFTPLLGRLTVSADKTMASLDFDTRTLPNGVLLARISAFDRAAGTAGATEIVAMPARRWTLANDPPPTVTQIPPASVMPAVHISNLDLPYVDPASLVTMRQMEDAAYDAMLQNEWPRVEAEMLRYIPAHVVLFPPTPNGFSGPWYSCLSSHTRVACREAMSNMIGLMQSKRP